MIYILHKNGCGIKPGTVHLDGRVFYSVIFVAALATLAAVGMLGGFSV
ncbi:hypothetical protein [Rhodococcus globerulus]